MNFMKPKITVLVATLLLLSAVFGICASAAAPSQYDATVYGSDGNVYLSSADILENYFGEDISEEESEFFDKLESLSAFETLNISYNEIINTNKADVEYIGDRVKISAREYEYVGASGKSFLWLPQSASFKGTSVPLFKEADVYIGELVCDEPFDNDSIFITYRADVAVSSEDINEIINLYRNSAEYAYNKSEYDAYVIEKKLYDEAKSKYDNYLSDVEEYERLLFEYENYESVTLKNYYENIEKYQKYEVDKREYDAKLKEYNDYLAEYNKIKKQLDAVKLIDVPMTLNRTVYSAVMGGTVDQVLENESAIVAAGADKEAVRLAGIATERVRSLMKGFKACKTDKDKYVYYKTNYENLCESFLLLTQTLDALYTKAVRAFLVANDKNQKYVILVAQLALISNALIDGELRDYNGKVSYTSSWEFDRKTVKEILGNKDYFVDDDTAAPIDIPPEVKKPAELIEVKKPVFPIRPEKPITPNPVSNPGNAPEVKNNPDNSLRQTVLPAVYNALDTNYIALLKQSYEGEKVPDERDTVGAAGAVISVFTELKKTYNAQSVSVTFKLPDGSVSVLTADKGSAVVCEANVPFSYVDAHGDTFVLAGWRYEENAFRRAYNGAVDLKAGFHEDAVLTPIYEHYYSISWEIEGEVYTKSVSVNENAVCPVFPEKADDGNFCYVFSGWIDESGEEVGVEIGKPTRDAKYVADFEKTPIVPLSTEKGADIKYIENTVVCDAEGFFGSSPINIENVIDRAVKRQSALTIKLWRGTLEFTFSDVLALERAKIKTVCINYNGSVNYDNYSVELRDANQNLANTRVKFTAKTQANDTNRYKLFFVENEEKTYVKYLLDENKKNVTFEAENGLEYVFRAEYVVSSAPNALVDFVFSNQYPIRNEWIEYQIIPKDGVEILEILIENDEGEAVAAWEEDSGRKGTFRIISNDVHLSVYARYKTYNVIFKANGKIIYQTLARHGDEITAPKAPSIGDDGVYSYKFVGWDKEITPAESDVIYEAVYEKIPLPEKEDTGGLKLSPKLKKLFYIAVVAFILLVAFITLLVVFIVRKKRLRKAKENGFASYGEYRLSMKKQKYEEKHDGPYNSTEELDNTKNTENVNQS